MKKIYWLTFAVVALSLAGTCIVLLERNRELNREREILYSALSASGLTGAELDYLEHSFILSLNNRIPLADFIADPADPAASLPDIPTVKQNPTLVFYHDQSQCNDCILFGMSKLKSFVEQTGIEPLVLTHYTDPQFLKNAERLLDAPFPTVNLPHKPGFGTENNPIFFVLDNQEVYAVFIPEKGIPRITNRYLEAILRTYWKKKDHGLFE